MRAEKRLRHGNSCAILERCHKCGEFMLISPQRTLSHPLSPPYKNSRYALVESRTHQAMEPLQGQDANVWN